jgi:hypothetical protein
MKLGGNNSWSKWETDNLINRLQADKHCEQMPNFVEDGFQFMAGGIGLNHFVSPGVAYIDGFRVERTSVFNITVVNGANFIFLKLNKVADPVSGYSSTSSLSVEVQSTFTPVPPAEPHILLMQVYATLGRVTNVDEYQKDSLIPRSRDAAFCVPEYFDCFEADRSSSLYGLYAGNQNIEGWNFNTVEPSNRQIVSFRRVVANTLVPQVPGNQEAYTTRCRGLRGKGYALQNPAGVTGQLFAANVPSSLLEIGAAGVIIFSRFWLPTGYAKQQLIQKGVAGLNTRAYSLEYDALNNRFEFKIGNGAAWSSSVYFTWANTDTNRWFHVVAGYDALNDKVLLSVNGANYQTVASGFVAAPVLGGAFFLGRDPDLGEYGTVIFDEVAILKDANPAYQDSSVPIAYYNHGLGSRYLCGADFGAHRVFLDEQAGVVYGDNISHNFITRSIVLDRKSKIIAAFDGDILNSAGALREFQVRIGIDVSNGIYVYTDVTAGDMNAISAQHYLEYTPALIPATINITAQVIRPLLAGNYTIKGNLITQVIRGI